MCSQLQQPTPSQNTRPPLTRRTAWLRGGARPGPPPQSAVPAWTAAGSKAAVVRRVLTPCRVQPQLRQGWWRVAWRGVASAKLAPDPTQPAPSPRRAAPWPPSQRAPCMRCSCSCSGAAGTSGASPGWRKLSWVPAGGGREARGVCRVGNQHSVQAATIQCSLARAGQKAAGAYGLMALARAAAGQRHPGLSARHTTLSSRLLTLVSLIASCLPGLVPALGRPMSRRASASASASLTLSSLLIDILWRGAGPGRAAAAASQWGRHGPQAAGLILAMCRHTCCKRQPPPSGSLAPPVAAGELVAPMGQHGEGPEAVEAGGERVSHHPAQVGARWCVTRRQQGSTAAAA